MYLGQMVEKARADELFAKPVHPYTQALLSAIPRPNLNDKVKRILLKGEITSPINLPDACRFAKRCNYAQDICHRSDPRLNEISSDHFAACHFPLL
jgi:peptide/nickel transport system ATP-binding protein